MTEICATPIAVLGSGSWGTALAIQLARHPRQVRLWGRDAAQIDAMTSCRANARYLPDARFPDALRVNANLEETLDGIADILIVVPSHAFREILERIKPLIPDNARIAWATKGFEQGSGKLPHQIVMEVMGSDIPTAVLSGPTFATEVGAGLPTALTVASGNAQFARDMAESLSGPNFRAYTTDDMVGVEVGGAVKNVLAIGAGISDGLGFGANTRVALITRGLHEMSRLGAALGGRAETFMGLSGMGDLVLTCTDDQSRNRRMGLALAAGKTVEQAAEEIGQVVEGVRAAQAVWQVAHKMSVEMPIVEQIYRVLYEDHPAREAVDALMGRELKSEA